MRALVVVGVGMVVGWVPTAAFAAEHPLARICRFLETGSANQVAAARRSLAEEVSRDDMDILLAELHGSWSPRVLRPLQDRWFDLLSQELISIEESLQRFDDARANATRLSAAIRQRRDSRTESAPPIEGDPEDARVDGPPGDANDEDRLVELRATRDRSRREIRRAYDVLAARGLSLVPAVFRRLQGGSASLAVERFYDHLLGDLLERLEERFPNGDPGLDEETRPGRFERRCLVPVLSTLVDRHGDEWIQLREALALEALDRFATYDPEEIREARQIFLELGPWGVERMNLWATDTGAAPSEVPPEIRALYAAWNHLAAPIDLASQTALPIDQYTSLAPEQRQALIYRLEWVTGKQAVPVFARLLAIEPDLSLQVEAAAALSRLEDPRGAEFLRRLGLANSIELENISRQVLIIEAIHRRETGDVEGALNDLLTMLRRFPTDHRVHYEIAFTALLARKLDLAIQHFREAILADPNDPLAHYNLACSLALAGQTEPALDALENAIRSGFRDAAHIQADSDLHSLRALPRFEALLRRLR